MGGASRRRKSPPFVMFYHSWIDTAAFRALSGNEAKLLLILLRLYNGDNNGNLFLSERKAADLVGCAPLTASRSFKGLEARGFIRPSRRGTFRAGDPVATSWRLTMWPAFGKVATHDYRNWSE